MDTFRVRGCVKTIRILLDVVERRHRTPFLRRWRSERFDRKHNIRAADFILLDSLGLAGNEGGHDYAGTPVFVFEEAISSLKLDFSEFHFVDYGSGMGKALLLAARYPFQSVTGVEFSEELHNIAKANITTWRLPEQKCFNVKSICADASHWAPPEEPCVLYFFNPFRPKVLTLVLQNILQSALRAPRPIYVVYLFPSYPEVFNKFPELQCKADVTMHDRLYAIYRVSTYE